MFLLIRRRIKRKPLAPPRPRRGFRGGGVLGLAAAAVPAHGFVIGRHGLMAPGVHPPSPFMQWVKMFLGACAWAAMMAAGMLVYQHFVQRWEKEGLPVLPVQALTTGAAAVAGGAARPAATIPLGPANSQQRARQQEPPRQMSWLDEYEG